MTTAVGLRGVALTDRVNLFGALEFSVLTKEAGVQPIVGCALPVTGIGGRAPERWAETPTLVLPAPGGRGHLNLPQPSSLAPPDAAATEHAPCPPAPPRPP